MVSTPTGPAFIVPQDVLPTPSVLSFVFNDDPNQSAAARAVVPFVNGSLQTSTSPPQTVATPTPIIYLTSPRLNVLTSLPRYLETGSGICTLTSAKAPADLLPAVKMFTQGRVRSLPWSR